MYLGLYPPKDRVAPKSSNHVIICPDEGGQDETTYKFVDHGEPGPGADRTGQLGILRDA